MLIVGSVESAEFGAVECINKGFSYCLWFFKLVYSGFIFRFHGE
jgi:hypothetical protein